MAARDRVQVTVSLPMRVALAILAQRNGITMTTQAAMLLRQALDRTIGSEAGQREISRARLYQDVSAWRAERQIDRAVEVEYARQIARGGLATFTDEAPNTGQSTADRVRVEEAAK